MRDLHNQQRGDAEREMEGERKGGGRERKREMQPKNELQVASAAQGPALSSYEK